jgi:hypothetical protein
VKKRILDMDKIIDIPDCCGEAGSGKAAQEETAQR